MMKASIEDLIQFLRRFCLHQALAFIGEVQVNIFHNRTHLSEYYPQNINEWSLAFISKVLILNSNDHRSKIFNENDLINAINIYNNLQESILDSIKNNRGKEFDAVMNSYLIRTANLQFPQQSGIFPQLPRSYILFDIIPREIENPAIDIHKEIKELYGLTVKEIIILGFSIFAALKNGYFYSEYLVNNNHEALKKVTTKENINKLFSVISATYKQLRRSFNEEKDQEGYEKYIFNSLKSYPVVRTQIGKIAIPIPRFFIDSCTNGIYYSLMDRFKESKSNVFLEFFGKEIFENYIGLHLKQIYGDERLLKEWEYKKGKKTYKTSDWTIISGNTAILIECKTSGINKEAKSIADLEQVKENLELRVVQAIKQMNSIVIEAKRSTKGLEKLFSIKKFYFVIITFDRIFLAGTPAIKELVERKLNEIGIKKCPEYQIISIEELENLIQILKKISFEKILEKKFQDKNWSTYDFDIFLSYFLKDKGMEIKQNNELLMDKYNELFKGLKKHDG